MNHWLRLKDFSVVVKNKRCIVHPISLSLGPTESLAIFGTTGSGKTSLLKAIAGLAPFVGTLSLLGQTWTHASPKKANLTELYWQIGFTFQKNALFEFLTVLENMCFPASFQPRNPETQPHVVATKAQQLLTQVGLWHHRHKYPQTLSGGMKKRLALARSLMKSPKVLICDDPLAGLDPFSATQVLETIRIESQSYVTHRLMSIHSIEVARRDFTHVLVLDSGKPVSVSRCNSLKHVFRQTQLETPL